MMGGGGAAQFFVSIPQAVWIACNTFRRHGNGRGDDVSIPQAVWIACNNHGYSLSDAMFKSFNTASGMDCMQYYEHKPRKGKSRSFNTASGMDCMQFIFCGCLSLLLYKFQYRKRYGLHAIRIVVRTRSKFAAFQYRKRYGLHAI